MSLVPGATPSPGELFQQANDSDAWEMCYHFDGTLQPVSAPGWCAANNSGLVQLRPCNSHPDQTWNIPSVPGIFHVQSSLGGYLRASGGVSFLDTVVQHLSDCSS
jgi:hypothetical protein